MQDPDPYLINQDLVVPCLVQPEHHAIIDAEHRSFVNYEIFYFSDLEAKARFDSDPTHWCGVLTDPVTKERFLPARRSPHLEHEGRAYYFLQEASLAQFQAMPDSFALARFGMREMEGGGAAHTNGAAGDSVSPSP